MAGRAARQAPSMPAAPAFWSSVIEIAWNFLPSRC
jgi:hypothetical protein